MAVGVVKVSQMTTVCCDCCVGGCYRGGGEVKRRQERWVRQANNQMFAFADY